MPFTISQVKTRWPPHVWLLLAASLAGGGLLADEPTLPTDGKPVGNAPASEAGNPLAAAGDSQRPLKIRAERNLVFARPEGTKLTADVFRPANDQVYPLILMIHGGAWSAGDKWNLHDHARELALAGYVAVPINYRLAPLHPYPAQLEDCQAALQWAHAQAAAWRADPERVAVWGYSAGAHLGALLATNPSPGAPRLRAAVLGGAPCEFSFVPENSQVLAPVMGGSRRECPEVYRNASPLTFASEDDCPMFFFHGTQDLLVPPSSSRLLYERLNQLGVPAEYHTVDEQGHLLTFLNPEARRLAIAFLNQHVAAAP